MPRPVLGVIGGMGPLATVDFEHKFFRAAGAPRDEDNFRVIVDNDPAVPGRVAAAEGRGPSPAPYLHAMAARLVAAGATVLAMPCNTAHIFFAEASAGIGVPWPSLIQAGTAAARAALAGVAAAGPLGPAPPSSRSGQGAPRPAGGKGVGLLGSAPTVASGMYQALLAGVPVTGPGPAGQALVDAAIARVKAGELGPETHALARRAAAATVLAGAGCVLLGCTELPLVLADGDLDVPLVDATAALARECVRVLRAQRAGAA